MQKNPQEVIQRLRGDTFILKQKSLLKNRQSVLSNEVCKAFSHSGGNLDRDSQSVTWKKMGPQATPEPQNWGATA